MLKLFLLVWLALVAAISPAVAVTYAKPNIIILLTDDHTMSAMTGKDVTGKYFLPFISAKRQHARKFDYTYFSESLCCPSRTSMLTGMYPHNHGVTSNGEPNGGYFKYVQNNLDVLSWPYRIRGVSSPAYYTALIGKILNDPKNLLLTTQPKGWFYSFIQKGGYTGNMFNWAAIKNGVETPRYLCSTDDCYQTRVFTDEAVGVIRRQNTLYKRPLAMLLAPFSPHLPAQPALLHAHDYDNEPLPMGPSFNEVDVSDKPAFVQALPMLTSEEITSMTTDWRNSLANARSVDDMFRRVWTELEISGQLANTYIIFTSDNGYSWGEHRIKRKIVPYEESIRTIMMIWGPRVVAGWDHHIVSLQDLYPTIMEIADEPIPSRIDGRSLMPLLAGQSPPWRNSFLVQGVKPDDDEGGSLDQSGNEYTAVVTKNWKFIDYDGELEYYDLAADPDELNNTASTLAPARVTALTALMTSLFTCRHICRAVEDAALP